MALKETKDWYGSKRNQGLGDRDKERTGEAREEVTCAYFYLAPAGPDVVHIYATQGRYSTA